jgi:hypothetical protein
MRTHNPLHEPAPSIYSLAARFCFLIRRDGTRAVPTGERNARVTIPDVPFPQTMSRLGAAAHVLRIDFEVQQVSREGFLYLTLTSPGQEDADGKKT